MHSYHDYYYERLTAYRRREIQKSLSDFCIFYFQLPVACDALKMSKASLEFVETDGGVLV